MTAQRPAWLRELVNDIDVEPKAFVANPNLSLAHRPSTGKSPSSRRTGSKSRQVDPAKLPPYDKDLECRHCGKRFRRVCNYREHQRVHSNEFKFTCSVSGCDRKFMWRSSIQAHLRSHQAKIDRRRRMPQNQPRENLEQPIIMLPKVVQPPLSPISPMTNDITCMATAPMFDSRFSGLQRTR